jgi:hypothetical protein
MGNTEISGLIMVIYYDLDSHIYQERILEKWGFREIFHDINSMLYFPSQKKADI